MARPKRRNYFIDRKFQSKFVLLTIVGLIVYTLMFLAIIFVPVLTPLGSELPIAEQAESARAFLILHRQIWPAVGVVILLMGGLSIFVSHRIAGPAYRLNKSLVRFADGDLEVTVNLRKGDDLQELADQVNRHLDELRDFIKTLHKEHALLDTCIEDLQRQGEGATRDEAALLRLKESKERLAATLARFDIDS